MPKTLIQYLIRWVADTRPSAPVHADVLESILDTAITPELVPPADGRSRRPAQRSEDVVGPYELQDFHLYHVLRFGFRPSKVAFLAYYAWGDRERGRWPGSRSPPTRNEYDLAEIRHWLRVFLTALLRQPVQALGAAGRPEGRLGRVAVAARRLAAPSDGSATTWLSELDAFEARSAGTGVTRPVHGAGRKSSSSQAVAECSVESTTSAEACPRSARGVCRVPPVEGESLSETVPGGWSRPAEPDRRLRRRRCRHLRPAVR